MWVEVSLLVEGELAEPVAGVLADHVPRGVVLERVAGEGKGEDSRVRVFAYLPADSRLEERRAAIDRALWHLGQIRELPTPSYMPVEQEDWRTAWQKNYRPIPLGKRLIVVPAWMDPPPTDREVVYISPGMAFGSGTHPSTQLALALIDEHLAAGLTPGGMIDIGCGSGILSIAAVKLGVPRVWALDHDPQAVEVTQSNLRENDVRERVTVEQGTLAEVRQGRLDIPPAPLVCANIIAPVLRQLFEEGLGTLVESGGTLILSGMLKDQVPEMLDLLNAHQFRLLSRQQKGDWVGLRAQRAA